MSIQDRYTLPHSRRLAQSAAIIGALALAGCDAARMPEFLKGKPKDETVSLDAGGARGGRTVERDIEAPEIFQADEAGLWDGRPSLGGVWVAHPDVKEPERVIIRNQTNGQFVIGALFKRERETPGPELQVSSDAAAALDMLAGQPTQLNVVALRREEVTEPSEADNTATAIETASLAGAGEIESAPLDPVASAAGAAIENAPAEPDIAAPEPTEIAAVPAAAPAPAPRPAPSSLGKPFVQIGIFSVEQNALNTAESMRQAGMVPTVKEQTSSGKTFWRVVVGPAQTKSEINALLKKIKAKGFADAYAVSS